MQRFARRLSTFAAGDVVVIRSMARSDRLWLSEPLAPSGSTNVNQGSVSHDNLIGLHSRSLVSSDKDNKYIATHASTEDYIQLSRRAATPIYPLDAASLVTLADLHIDYPQLQGEEPVRPLQFFEAGTGHGSLTLAICSRIHSANCFYKTHGVRGAVLHSIDKNQAHSNVGKRTINTFRRGIYADDVEFHIAESPEHWLEDQPSEEFLDGAFLDLPDIAPNIAPLASRMKQDSPLVVFCPSITQIMEVVKCLKEDKGIRLTHIRTVQLIPGMGGGLQEWDTRYAFIRATGEEGAVCRPKVGSRVVGGGFAAVFRKLPASPASPSPSSV